MSRVFQRVWEGLAILCACHAGFQVATEDPTSAIVTVSAGMVFLSLSCGPPKVFG